MLIIKVYMLCYADENNLGLFLLVSILSQTFFTFVRRHFVSFMFFTVWHNYKIFFVLFI